MMKKAAFAMALAFFCQAVAAEWGRIGVTQKDGAVYVDRSSMAEMGARRKIWVMIDFRGPKEVAGKAVLSEKYLYIYDCGARMWGIGMILSYEGALGGGAIVDSVHEDAPQFIHVVPESAADAVRKIACVAAPREKK